MNVSLINNYNVNEHDFFYYFKLNNGDDSRLYLLPYFITNVYFDGVLIDSFDARSNNKELNYKKTTNATYLFVFNTDNQNNSLNSTIILDQKFDLQKEANITEVIVKNKTGNHYIEYIITITNNGNVDLENILFTDVFDKLLLKYISSNNFNLIFDNINTLSMVIDNLHVNETLTFSYILKVINPSVNNTENLARNTANLEYYTENNTLMTKSTYLDILIRTLFEENNSTSTNNKTVDNEPETEIDKDTEINNQNHDQKMKNSYDPKTEVNNSKSENKDNENNILSSSAAMKKTGIPLISILLIFLSSLGIFIGKKQSK